MSSIEHRKALAAKTTVRGPRNFRPAYPPNKPMTARPAPVTEAPPVDTPPVEIEPEAMKASKPATGKSSAKPASTTVSPKPGTKTVKPVSAAEVSPAPTTPSPDKQNLADGVSQSV